MAEDEEKKLKLKKDSKEKVKSKNSDKDKDFLIGKLRLGTAAIVSPKKKKLEEVIAKEFLEDVFDKKKIEEFEEFQKLGEEEAYIPGVRDSYREEERESEDTFDKKFGSDIYEEKRDDNYSETNLKRKDSYESIIDIRNLKEGKDKAMFGIDSSQFRKNKRDSNTLN
jgi:hypothetical protein